MQQRISTDLQLVSYWNVVLMVITDVLLGVALSMYMYNALDSVPREGAMFLGRLDQMMQESILWLMGHPGGLKLNTPLAHALGACGLFYQKLWSCI